jgi:hypothetical protein
MGDNTGKHYEKLATVVLQSIINQSDVRNIIVEHNKTLRGKSGTVSHQIDVYWKFALGHVVYETVVEAKDWKNQVDQGEIFKFKAVLDDLPGQPKGIFVSRAGYQQGAIDYALHHGILIYEFREEDDQPNLILTTTGWAHYAVVGVPFRGIIRSVEETIPENVYALGFVVDVFTPCFSNINFEVSTSWLRSEYPTMDFSKIGEVKTPEAFLHEKLLYDKDRAVASNLAVVFQELAMAMNKEGVEQKRASHVFQKPTFIRTDSLLVPYTKIDAVSVDVSIEHKQEIRRGRMANFAPWVLRQLNSGHTDLFLATPSATSSIPTKNDV